MKTSEKRGGHGAVCPSHNSYNDHHFTCETTTLKKRGGHEAVCPSQQNGNAASSLPRNPPGPCLPKDLKQKNVCSRKV